MKNTYNLTKLRFDYNDIQNAVKLWILVSSATQQGIRVMVGSSAQESLSAWWESMPQEDKVFILRQFAAAKMMTFLEETANVQGIEEIIEMREHIQKLEESHHDLRANDYC